MNTISTIPVTRTTRSRLAGYDFSNISFGANPTDHIFLADYKNGEWGTPRIVPFQDLSLSPVALCLHYGQTVFEGLKAYRLSNGQVSLFRPLRHHERLNKSLERMCMPAIPEALFIEALQQLVSLDEAWVPAQEDASLYIRPFVIATEPRLGVKISEEYLFGIVCMPMASYYSANLKVKVERDFVRAAEGGTGAAKCGGNYGAAFYATRLAKEQGYDQVLWTDDRERSYIEESGTMNVVFCIDGTLITPPLSGTILDGVTRDSLLTLARDAGIPTEERKISYQELEQACRTGKKLEAFGVGTAAVVSPIELIGMDDRQYAIAAKDDALCHVLKKELQAIRTGRKEDRHQWNYLIPVNR